MYGNKRNDSVREGKESRRWNHTSEDTINVGLAVEKIRNEELELKKRNGY